METLETNNPGSDESVARGCLCPVIDNGRGDFLLAMDRRGWIVNEHCPLHGTGSGWVSGFDRWKGVDADAWLRYVRGYEDGDI